MGNMKKVSIIAPIYKSEEFLPKMVESIRKQTYQNFELILVDDESPDNSGKLCDEYAQKDVRIKVIHKKNGGCSSARNEGLKHVTGEYLTFIDGDDWMEPDCLEYFVTLIESNDCEMAMSRNLMMDSKPNQIKNDEVCVLTPEQAVCCILYVDVPVAAWNKMYKTDIVKNNNITFEISWFGEGLLFSSMAAQYTNRVAVGCRKVYGYRMNNVNSGTTTRRVKDGLGMLEHSIYVKNRLVLKTPNVENAADWHINRNTFNLLWYIIGSGEEDNYRDKYNELREELLRTFPKVFIKSKVNIFKKLIIVFTTFTPRIAAYMAGWRRSRIFQGKRMF